MIMEIPELNKYYWEERYMTGNTGWDIGQPSTPLQEYFDQLNDKSMRILIPGCGRAWEGEYLHKNGFTNVYLADVAPTALKSFKERVPSFNDDHLIQGDFFHINMKFDMVIEQTFFCALAPKDRRKYVTQVWNLLEEQGKLVGLLFENDFGKNHPPFGGTKSEYLRDFEPWFRIKYFDLAYNSITPRQGKELFMNLTKR